MYLAAAMITDPIIKFGSNQQNIRSQFKGQVSSVFSGMFGLFQEKLGEVVYVQLPEVGTEVELDGKKLTVTRHGHKVMYRTTEVEIDSNWTWPQSNVQNYRDRN